MNNAAFQIYLCQAAIPQMAPLASAESSYVTGMVYGATGGPLLP